MDYVSFPPATLLNPTPVVLVSCAEKAIRKTGIWSPSPGRAPSIPNPRWSLSVCAKSGILTI